MPSTEPEICEDWTVFSGFSDIDGCVWQFKLGPMLQSPTSISRFVADKEGDSWYMCFMSFQNKHGFQTIQGVPKVHALQRS